MNGVFSRSKKRYTHKKEAGRGGITILLQTAILFSPTTHPLFLLTPVSRLSVSPFLSNHPLLNPGTYKQRK